MATMLKRKEIFVILLLLSTCTFSQSNRLTQFSTINALMTGVYDGNYSVSDLKKYGDFGIGTFNNLDGEMVLLDGICYKIKSDGTVQKTEDTQHVPFAAVTLFNRDTLFGAIPEGANQKVFEQQIDSLLPTLNIFYAIRIDGTFQVIKARSVPRQTPPYIPLIEVVKQQAEFVFEDVEGTIIGFRSPA